jgi:hypothetical protein
MTDEEREIYEMALRKAKTRLAEIQNEYDALGVTVGGLERLLVSSPKAKYTMSEEIERPLIFAHGEFDGMTNRQAAMKILCQINRPLKSKEIADAISGSGYQHGSKNYKNTMNTTLDRIFKKQGWVDKVDEGWQINSIGREIFESKSPTLFDT